MNVWKIVWSIAVDHERRQDRRQWEPRDEERHDDPRRDHGSEDQAIHAAATSSPPSPTADVTPRRGRQSGSTSSIRMRLLMRPFDS